MPGHVVAMGGGALLSRDSRIEDFMLGLTRSDRPRVCFLPTAGGEKPEWIVRFYEEFTARDCEPSHLPLFGMPAEPAAHLAQQDVIYVGGGNTANMLAIWCVHGIDTALREAWERGAVVGGMSAGANCWFDDSVTDSFGPTLRELGAGLGLLPGSFCPHYDGEPERRPTYTRLVREGVLPPGYAADDDAAFHFEGTELAEVVSQRDGARGYRVTADGEEPIEPRLL
ncbi:MAG: Type 1 glutamine amidotransferase-like domain-containing protein [Gaiellaceae bacterium]